MVRGQGISTIFRSKYQMVKDLTVAWHSCGLFNPFGAEILCCPFSWTSSTSVDFIHFCGLHPLPWTSSTSVDFIHFRGLHPRLLRYRHFVAVFWWFFIGILFLSLIGFDGKRWYIKSIFFPIGDNNIWFVTFIEDLFDLWKVATTYFLDLERKCFNFDHLNN